LDVEFLIRWRTLEEKEQGNHGNVHTYKGYKTRQNKKGHDMHSKARLKTLKMVRCWCIDVELCKNFCAK